MSSRIKYFNNKKDRNRFINRLKEKNSKNLYINNDTLIVKLPKFIDLGAYSYTSSKARKNMGLTSAGLTQNKGKGHNLSENNIIKSLKAINNVKFAYYSTNIEPQNNIKRLTLITSETDKYGYPIIIGIEDNQIKSIYEKKSNIIIDDLISFETKHVQKGSINMVYHESIDPNKFIKDLTQQVIKAEHNEVRDLLSTFILEELKNINNSVLKNNLVKAITINYLEKINLYVKNERINLTKEHQKIVNSTLSNLFKIIGFKEFKKDKNIHSKRKSLLNVLREKSVGLQIKVKEELKESINKEDKHMDKKEELYRLYKDVCEIYQNDLYHYANKAARNYLYNRKINDNDIHKFGLGYAVASPKFLYGRLNKMGYSPELLEESKLFSEKNKRWPRFTNRIMFPLKDEEGNIVGFSGRSIDPKEKQYKYLHSASSDIFEKSKLLFGYDVNKNLIDRNKNVVICEGNFDVISYTKAGIPAVASLGVAISDYQAEMLANVTNNNVTIAFDNDNAGRLATCRVAEKFFKVDTIPTIFQIQKFKDASEVIENLGKTELKIQHMENTLSKAESVSSMAWTLHLDHYQKYRGTKLYDDQAAQKTFYKMSQHLSKDNLNHVLSGLGDPKIQKIYMDDYIFQQNKYKTFREQYQKSNEKYNFSEMRKAAVSKNLKNDRNQNNKQTQENSITQ